ncbi:UDP-N-acetyl-D-mannosamine dehydrogenase [Virgibacillus profundi]|uniref:UDP-N-acetyl-D-mannosamine dehydrogenase n=1 Tax=Virgibacillus profundi TaxID=2024555 RepID=A0A2A2IIU5_9BACI|nr:nucleotide sugar dehydrogenase [Virgibacillus profundi]PAV31308.1 UDP-N-acetyl-D-mannosamine dehydrogenase [Virgibacillus profundi]PXY55493.1 nucleotide sugar dehydrogenase [Virgibacillus profundi]
MEKICVIGLGYIGLPTSGFLADNGYEVYGVDVNEDVVETLSKGEIHIEEPSLAGIISESIHNGKLKVSTTPVQADIFIIAVPTPVHDNKTSNLDYVKKATESIIPYMKKGDIVIIESTIPPRTIDDIVVPIIKAGGFNPEEDDVYVSHCPERVIPGRIMTELIENNRIVGGYTEEAAKRTADFYRKVVKGQVFETSALTAEMSKLMENTYRDVNIALANELSKVSEKLGVNAHEVVKLANMHPRVNIHQPGPGVGGHCIAVDPYFIIEKANELSPLMQTAREINSSMPGFVIDQIKKITMNIENPTIAILGLSYKGNVDDVRESPAIEIANQLVSADYHIKCHDPYVKQSAANLELFGLEESLAEADVALVLADHNVFKEMDSMVYVNNMKTPVILDTKNCIQDSDEITLYKIGDLGKLKSIR